MISNEEPTQLRGPLWPKLTTQAKRRVLEGLKLQQQAAQAQGVYPPQPQSASPESAPPRMPPPPNET